MACHMLATENNKQILIVDRDVTTVESLRHKLTEAGFGVRSIDDGAAAMNVIAQRPPHLVIFDWNIPGFAGLEVFKGMRRVDSPTALRLIILSALAAEQDVILGLSLGADDYIAKPFSTREVVARVSVLLRGHRIGGRTNVLTCDDLRLDGAANRVTADGKVVNLRAVEFRLLEFLMSHLDKTLSRAQLKQQVWGNNDEVDERTVDVNIQRLRKLLSEVGYDAYIHTIRGFGYRFAPP